MKNVNLTDILLSTAPVKTRLAFGLNTNVVLKSIDNTVRKDKNGNKVNKNCYMTFVQVDPENTAKTLAGYTFSYFNIDDKYIVSSFLHQLNQLMSICEVVGDVKTNDTISEAIYTIIEDNDLVDDLAGDETKNGKGFRQAQKDIVESVIENLQPFFNNTDNLLQMVVVTSRNGNFLDLPKEDSGFLAKMSAKKLAVGARYKRIYLKSQEVETDEPENMDLDDTLDLDDVLDLDKPLDLDL